MAQIVGGKVTFKRTFQPEQYGSRGAEAEISFVIGEGEELGPWLDLAGKLAQDKVMELVYAKAPAGAKAVAADLPPVKTEPVKTTPVATTKEAAAAAMNAKEAAPKGKPGPKPKVKPEEAPAFDESAPENQPDITDAELVSACGAKIAELQPTHGDASGKVIRALINTFVEPPKKSADIPQNLRAAFLAKLAELA